MYPLHAPASPKFRGESFAGGLQTPKFVKVSSLESFPLYDSAGGGGVVETSRVPRLGDVKKLASV